MKKQKSMKGLIIFLVVLVVIAAAVAGYFYYQSSHHNRQRFQGMNPNFQLNESQISDVTSFFSSNPTTEDMNSYCGQNRGNCFYYCKNINSGDALCKEIMNFTRPGQPAGGPRQ